MNEKCSPPPGFEQWSPGSESQCACYQWAVLTPLSHNKIETFLFFQDIRIGHTVILDDPFEDPPGLEIPDRSPPPSKEMLASSRIGADEDLVTILKLCRNAYPWIQVPNRQEINKRCCVFLPANACLRIRSHGQKWWKTLQNDQKQTFFIMPTRG